MCVLNKSLDCWESVLNNSTYGCGFLNAKEILDTTVMIFAEDWQAGLKPLIPYIEASFSKISILRRIEFLTKLMKINNEKCLNELLSKVDKILIFIEWI